MAPSDHWFVRAFARNLFNEKYLAQVSQTSTGDIGVPASGSYLRHRRWPEVLTCADRKLKTCEVRGIASRPLHIFGYRLRAEIENMIALVHRALVSKCEAPRTVGAADQFIFVSAIMFDLAFIFREDDEICRPGRLVAVDGLDPNIGGHVMKLHEAYRLTQSFMASRDAIFVRECQEWNSAAARATVKLDMSITASGGSN